MVFRPCGSQLAVLSWCMPQWCLDGGESLTFRVGSQRAGCQAQGVGCWAGLCDHAKSGVLHKFLGVAAFLSQSFSSLIRGGSVVEEPAHFLRPPAIPDWRSANPICWVPAPIVLSILPCVTPVWCLRASGTSREEPRALRVLLEHTFVAFRASVRRAMSLTASLSTYELFQQKVSCPMHWRRRLLADVSACCWRAVVWIVNSFVGSVAADSPLSATELVGVR